jgi:hypothetical protein
MAGLALGAGQRIFLVRSGMQENREILAHRLEAARQHILGRSANDDVIAILNRQTEQLVADRSADREDLHVG